ncbi:MAG TPA: polyprenyl synthetase family protein [Pseudobdellovibrionaceae bacterium]|nr:polyprenyl synthetase family protein [Pseudobdellovibrionaceae bacterium]
MVSLQTQDLHRQGAHAENADNAKNKASHSAGAHQPPPPLRPSQYSLKVYDPRDFPAYLPKLNQLYDDLFTGGKGFRAKLIAVVCKQIQVPLQTEHLLSQTIEFIHNSSLLHDDLVDRSILRRGKSAAWTKYSPEYAVLAGDYLLARVMVNLSLFGNIQLVQYTAEMISDLLEGEWLQDSVVGDLFVSLKQLDRIHNLKTASLFKWCLAAPFIASKRSTPELHSVLEELGSLLGQLFQRSDDLLDYNVRNYEGKAILGDLRSGYLNSFGAFVAQDLSRSEMDRMARSTELPEFIEAIGGQSEFQKRLDEFDRMNQELISVYNHHLHRLEQMLLPHERPLIEQLRPLTDLLYWRRRP